VCFQSFLILLAVGRKKLEASLKILAEEEEDGKITQHP
jgi:hypothetical protein